MLSSRSVWPTVRAVTAAAVCAAFLAGCSSQTDGLAALQREPVATLEVSSANEPRRIEIPTTRSFGVEGDAVVRQRFAPQRGATADEVFGEAVAAVRGEGWVLDRVTEKFYRGERRGRSGAVVTLEVYLVRATNDVVVQLTT